MPGIPCDIVLLPSKELSARAIEASKSTKQFGTFFTLEDGRYFPHMSLYMFQLNESDVSKVVEVLTKIAKDTKAVSVQATSYCLGTGYGVGYVDPEYKVTDELSSIQDEVIDAVNPLRAGMRESDARKMQDSTGVKLENLRKYGYPAVGKLFRPHITLTRLKEHDPKVLDALPQDVATFSGMFDRIGLFEMGENGTCIRKIAEFALSK